MLAVENEVKVVLGSVNVAVELSRVVAAKQIEFNDKAEEAAKQAAQDARKDVVSLSKEGLQAKDSGKDKQNQGTGNTGDSGTNTVGTQGSARVDIKV